MPSYEFYKSKQSDLEKIIYEKNPVIKLAYIDDDLGWFPIDTSHPFVKFTIMHGPPVCKIVLWSIETDITKDFIEYIYYIFADGTGNGIVSQELRETCNAWLKQISTY